MVRRRLYHKRLRERHKGYRKRNSRRSKDANRGWDTRVRRQGMRQLIDAFLNFVNLISRVRSIKEISLALIKVTKPRFYRKNRVLKMLDKF